MPDTGILEDDLKSPEIAAFLKAHLAEMFSASPPESCHALDLDNLRQPEITFWAVRHADGSTVLACGALKNLGDGSGEIKSMRVSEAARGQGLGAAMLTHIIDQARRMGITELLLETGTPSLFTPARKLYEKFGFTECPPFGDYTEDPYSVYMRLEV